MSKKYVLYVDPALLETDKGKEKIDDHLRYNDILHGDVIILPNTMRLEQLSSLDDYSDDTIFYEVFERTP